MPRIIAAVIISLLAGFAVGAWLGGGEQEAPAVMASGPVLLGSDASVEERIANLEQIILQEREARLALEDTLATLFDDLEQLEAADERAASARERAQQARDTTRSQAVGRNDAEWLLRYQERRVARLVEGGFTEDEARRALELESQVAYAALQSSWDAQRNGEQFDRFSPEYDPLSLLRRELGDDGFELYLKAQGQPTTIGISQVYAGSPGSEAGLRPGDRLVSYDGERVYSIYELRRQAMQGASGESVVIEVERDGMRMQLSVPRGPIGITGNGARIRGVNWWGG